VTRYQWNPTAHCVERANVTRLARARGLAGIDELRARSVADTAWLWDPAATDLGLCRGVLPLRLMETEVPRRGGW
jgi:acetyl-CoA synthetase